MIAQEGAEPLRTLSAVFDVVKECDERDYQRAVVADNAPGRHILHADSIGPLADLDRVLWYLDEPVDAGNLYLNWHLYAMAQADGVRVVLDGFDGDSTISHGLGLFADLAHDGQWLRLASELRAFAPRNGEVWQAALWQWYQRYRVDPVVSRHRPLRAIRGIARRARRVVATNGAPRAAAWRRLVRPDFARRVGLEERQRTFREKAGTERENHYRRLTHGGMTHTLELLDKAAAAFGIEVRFPFWDRRLIDFCLSLPVEQKIHRGWTRMVMRRAMDGILPPPIQWRGGKVDMHPSFEYGLRTPGRATLDELIDNPSNSDSMGRYVDLSVLRELYGRLMAGQTTADETNTVWRAASLGLWLRRAGAGSRN
jgi:asparagine synthase (glutamine-hydrolysing)